MHFLKYLGTEIKAFHSEFNKLVLEGSKFGVWYTKLGVRSKFCRILYDSNKEHNHFSEKKAVYVRALYNKITNGRSDGIFNS